MDDDADLSIHFTQIDSVWDVQVTLNGVTKTLQIAEGTSLLDAAEGVRSCSWGCWSSFCGRDRKRQERRIIPLQTHPQAFDDVPSLCRNGVCTTCAARVTQGDHSSYLVRAACVGPLNLSLFDPSLQSARLAVRSSDVFDPARSHSRPSRASPPSRCRTGSSAPARRTPTGRAWP